MFNLFTKGALTAGALILSLLLFILLFIVPSGAVKGEGPTFTIHLNNSFGFVDWSDGKVWVSVNTGRETGDNHRTFLQYFVLRFTPSGCCDRVEEGIGFIPDDDLIGSGMGMLSLHTDTSAQANPTFNRLIGSGGLINMEWQKIPATDFRYNLEARYFTCDSLLIRSGPSDEVNALAQGDVLGIPISGNVYAVMGMEHYVQTELSLPRPCPTPTPKPPYP